MNSRDFRLVIYICTTIKCLLFLIYIILYTNTCTFLSNIDDCIKCRIRLKIKKTAGCGVEVPSSDAISGKPFRRSPPTQHIAFMKRRPTDSLKSLQTQEPIGIARSSFGRRCGRVSVRPLDIVRVLFPSSYIARDVTRSAAHQPCYRLYTRPIDHQARDATRLW